MNEVYNKMKYFEETEKVGIRGNMKSGSSDGQTVTEERTHTTVSLFQRLKAQLEEEKLIIRDVEKFEIDEFDNIHKSPNGGNYCCSGFYLCC